jgi:hypothetical protein
MPPSAKADRGMVYHARWVGTGGIVPLNQPDLRVMAAFDLSDHGGRTYFGAP